MKALYEWFSHRVVISSELSHDAYETGLKRNYRKSLLRMTNVFRFGFLQITRFSSHVMLVTLQESSKLNMEM